VRGRNKKEIRNLKNIIFKHKDFSLEQNISIEGYLKYLKWGSSLEPAI
jgi:hypothetical protein